MPVTFEQGGRLPPGRKAIADGALDALLVHGFTGEARDRRLQLLRAWRGQRAALATAEVPVMAFWLDGSFVTTKEMPMDIDVVAVLDGPQFEAAPESTRLAASLLLGPQTYEKLGIDSYMLFEYPPEHVRRLQYEQQYRYWDKQWGHDRDGRPKGYLEVQR